jgi:hypothetical protein
METRKILRDVAGDFVVVLEVMECDPHLHDYGLSRQAWHRGLRLMRGFGAERALDLIDLRAERAADRGDYDTARRWRELITAIHAIQEDERLPGDRLH